MVALFASMLASAALAATGSVDPLSDAPEERPPAVAFVDAPTYTQALASWHGAEDINAWIGGRFEYDAARALRLSETQRQAKGRLPIYPPGEFFLAPKGVCVDLARFAVETLAAIAPQARPRYVMVEFDPVTIRGNALRRHWVAAFERDGKVYVFGDSKRPGVVAGPFDSVQAFAEDYARYRGRSIVAISERATYERTARTAARKDSAGSR